MYLGYQTFIESDFLTTYTLSYLIKKGHTFSCTTFIIFDLLK